jgi:hypothetical protein
VRVRFARTLACFLFLLSALPVCAQSGSELHFCLHGEPKTFDPTMVDDEASENVRYMTGGEIGRAHV